MMTAPNTNSTKAALCFLDRRLKTRICIPLACHTNAVELDGGVDILIAVRLPSPASSAVDRFEWPQLGHLVTNQPKR